MRYWLGWGLLAMVAANIVGMVLASIGPLGTIAVIVFTIVMTAMVVIGVLLIGS